MVHVLTFASGRNLWFWLGLFLFFALSLVLVSHVPSVAPNESSAVNLSRWFGAAWWVWLWPMIAGVPAIAIWTTYYKKKFSPKPKIAVT